jgi:hypothetical protein
MEGFSWTGGEKADNPWVHCTRAGAVVAHCHPIPCADRGGSKGGALPSVVANSTLDRNLGALLTLNGVLARELAELEPAEGLQWVGTDEGEAWPSATYVEGGGVARALASKRTPGAEGVRWASQADLAKHAAFVVRGFGLGYHVGALVAKVKGRGAVFVFEPDKRLLRAVLERIDCSGWIGSIGFVTDPDDRGAIVEAAGRVEPLIAMGTVVLDHPASMARLARDNAGQRFLERFTAVVAAVRVNVASVMIQTQLTLRNCLQNLDHYATRPGIETLRGVFAGRSAIVVSAGPSLQRNVELLSRPGVADRFVIVAAQTVLRPLLDRGIRPHFVCALDYNEVSKRFYEGLTEEAVRGVTLVAEPKVNPSVPAAFPGKIRMVGDEFLDAVLGAREASGGVARQMGRIQAGTTVAHLCCYLARFLGCDPVCLIGQDLGFTDGQYYAAGAAIHTVWGAELNGFKTLEMMEWQRIVRHRHILRKETDQLGRPVYTDEQMHTYLTQFARDFRAEAQAGHTTVDATEGGVRKPGTVCRTLAEVIDEALAKPTPAEAVGDVLARVERGEELPARAAALTGAKERLRVVRQGVWRIGELSRRAGLHLSEVAEHQRDQARVNGLIGKLEGLREQVREIEPGWWLVQLLNQTGMFRRMRADRALAVDDGLDEMERQRRQTERDSQNVRWLAESADAMAGLLDGATATLEGGERVTRDPPPSAESLVAAGIDVAATKTMALVMLDSRSTWWGAQRDPLAVRVQGRTALSLTLERLGRAERVGPIVVATDDVELARKAAAGAPAGTLSRVVFERVDNASAWPHGAARAARAMAATCWRGGLTDLTCFDEALEPSVAAAMLDRHGGGAASSVVACGASWCCVDPALVDAVVSRHAEDPSVHRMAFAHAAPGLGAALLERKLLTDVASARRAGGLWGSMGGLLGYSPVASAADVIGKGMCVPTDASVRQTFVRATADTGEEGAWLGRALDAAGLKACDATAAQIAAAVNAYAQMKGAAGPREVELRLSGDGGHMAMEVAKGWIARIAACNGAGAAVTLRDAELSHPRLDELLAMARRAAGGSLCVHVRTDLSSGPGVVERLLAAEPDIVSVDCFADTAELYAKLTGRPPEAFARLRINLERLVESRRAVDGEGGVRMPMVVPRLTRRDAVYDQVEDWYDRHLLACGWAVLDALEAPIRGDRITALPLPDGASRRLGINSVVVHTDGRVTRGGEA